MTREDEDAAILNYLQTPVGRVDPDASFANGGIIQKAIRLTAHMRKEHIHV